jgi:hypothetical protein
MNSKDMAKRGFSEPVDFVEGGEEKVPRKIGVYIIFRKDKEIDYEMSKSDIVKIGKCVEEGKGFSGKYYQYFNPGPTDTKTLRIRPMFKSSPHAIMWLEVTKEQAKALEKRLLNEFVRFHGQYPAFNTISK